MNAQRLVVEGEHVNLPLQGRKQALVESKSRPGEFHNVSWEFNDKIGLEEWCCSCESFEFRGTCRHVRAIDRWAAGKAVARLEEV